MIVSFLRPALLALVTLCREAEERGTETHAYLLGRRSLRECIITTVLRAGSPIEQAALTRPDYAASAVAMQPYLDRGERGPPSRWPHWSFVRRSRNAPQHSCAVPSLPCGRRHDLR